MPRKKRKKTTFRKNSKQSTGKVSDRIPKREGENQKGKDFYSLNKDTINRTRRHRRNKQYQQQLDIINKQKVIIEAQKNGLAQMQNRASFMELKSIQNSPLEVDISSDKDSDYNIIIIVYNCNYFIISHTQCRLYF